MAQTAVEWFYQRILSKDIKAVLQIAKEIEKDQHGTTWDAAIKAHDDRGGVHARSIVDFDEYFEQTYKTQTNDKQQC
jgi:hypothetical protein